VQTLPRHSTINIHEFAIYSISFALGVVVVVLVLVVVVDDDVLAGFVFLLEVEHDNIEEDEFSTSLLVSLTWQVDESIGFTISNCRGLQADNEIEFLSCLSFLLQDVVEREVEIAEDNAAELEGNELEQGCACAWFISSCC